MTRDAPVVGTTRTGHPADALVAIGLAFSDEEVRGSASDMPLTVSGYR
jgi:hypothetical protein